MFRGIHINEIVILKYIIKQHVHRNEKNCQSNNIYKSLANINPQQMKNEGKKQLLTLLLLMLYYVQVLQRVSKLYDQSYPHWSSLIFQGVCYQQELQITVQISHQKYSAIK